MQTETELIALIVSFGRLAVDEWVRGKRIIDSRDSQQVDEDLLKMDLQLTRWPI